MRIAQIAPLWESVPPAKYGAIESLVANLAQDLVRRGHEVTVFASGDSTASGRLIATHPISLNADTDLLEPEALRLVQIAEVVRRADEFDVLHSHLHSNSGLLGALALHPLHGQTIHTVHCYVNGDNRQLLSRLRANNYVAISDHQRTCDPSIRWLTRIHHGLDVDAFPYSSRADTPPYVAFLGRLRAEKRPDFAIQAARAAGLQIKIAGRVKPADREFFAQNVVPQLDGEKVQYLGELGFSDKVRLLGGARATVVTSVLPEPFGLVTVESMCCGTPVVATRSGAAGEIIRHGETGLIADSDDSFADLLQQVAAVSRATCRRHAEELYSLDRMTAEYENIYGEILTTSR
jgi:glycosyltransferase involved in cell wall biosynthesis